MKRDKSPAGKSIHLLRQGVDTTYKKGLGTHARSTVIQDLSNSDYDYFESYIGIDQEMKNNTSSSARFEVSVDGKQVYGSNTFYSTTSSGFVNVSLKGAKELKLVTTDAGINGNAADHTVWAHAKFVKRQCLLEMLY